MYGNYTEDSSSLEDDKYITIFGVTEKNCNDVENLFHDYDPIYLSANYNDNWNHSLELENIINESQSNILSESKEQKNENIFQAMFQEKPKNLFNNDSHANSIQKAVQNSVGNWIYARVSLEVFENIRDLQSKFVLDNNDVIYCMKGIYQSVKGYSEFPTKEDKRKRKLESIEPNVYKMSKIENLANLSFEGKSFNLKFIEFILGNYIINREEEIHKEDALGSREFILIIALIIFFIIFIYKVAY